MGRLINMFKKLLLSPFIPNRIFTASTSFQLREVLVVALLNLLVYTAGYHINGQIVVPNYGDFEVSSAIVFGLGALFSQAIIALSIYFLLVRTGWGTCTHSEAFGLVFFSALPSWLLLFLETSLQNYYWIWWSASMLWRIVIIATALHKWKGLSVTRSIVVISVTLILVALFSVHSAGIRI